MEPNKELPKEVVDDLQHNSNMKHTDKQDFGGFMHKKCLDDLRDGAKIAQSHYAPIIEAKDKEIAEVKEKLTVLQDRFVAEDASNARKFAEKDATISKLMGLLKDFVIGQNLETILQRHRQGGFKTPLRGISEQLFKDYCKENGIDLGGE